MLTRFGDFDRTFQLMDQFRRRMDRAWGDLDYGFLPTGTTAPLWPRVNLFDAGSTLIVEADVPGMTESDIDLTLDAEVLSITGERKAAAPEGCAVHRQERSSVKFSRSVTLPCKVDVEQTKASVKDGVLTITLTKAPDATPRKIAVQAS